MTENSVHKSRLERLRDALDSAEFDGAVIVPGPNLRYLTGVDSLLLERPFMLFVPTEGASHLVAPALESGPYRGGPLPLLVHSWTDSEGWAGAIRGAAKGVRLRGRWGAEGRLPFLFLHRLMKETTAKFDDAEPILQGLREVKDPTEVKLLKKSARILSKSFEEFPGLIEDGVTELELARRATETIYRNGGTKVDDLLVQSGGRAADPHALPSTKKVRRGESIIFDIGSTYEGYYADITRTFCIGKSAEVERVYDKVLEAEQKAIWASAGGVQVGKVDGAARRTLEKAGLGRYFVHRTGHGLGLEVHEAPYIVEGGKERLGESMCFTVEPGVYLKGRLGVRIEDNVLIEADKGVEISNPPKEFGWWA